MWLNARSKSLVSHSGPLVFTCDLSFGVTYLIADMVTSPRWVELEQGDFNDPILLGDKLAEACHSLGLRLHALPYQYGLAVLKSQLATLPPQTFVISNAEIYPEFAQDILALHRHGHKVIVQTHDPSYLELPENTRVVTADMLRLSQDEALELAANRLPPSHTTAIWNSTHGVHDLFVKALFERLNIPQLLLAGPHGPRLPPELRSTEAAGDYLELLITHQRWTEALELAAHHLPEKILQVLTEAGHVFHERGLHKRLWALLATLPTSLQDNELVLYWQLMAAFRLGQEQTLEPQVKTFLDHHEAPELRTLYAGVLAPYDQALAEAKRAHQSKPSAFTLNQMAFKTEDIQESIGLFEDSVKFAERHGHGYEVVRNAGSLAERLVFAGKFKEAVNWSYWALTEFDKRGLKDNTRRLHILNTWAYASILSNNLAGLEALLSEGISHLELAYPELAHLYRSTLGDFFLASLRPHEALKQYQSNFENASRNDLGLATYHMTRVFLELGMNKEALEISKRAVDLLGNEQPVVAGNALLAYGMALSIAEPENALSLSYLNQARQAFTSPYTAHRLLQISLYQAMVYLKLGERQKAKQTLESVSKSLSELGDSGLKLLTGPDEMFHEVLSLRSGQNVALALRLFGEGEVWILGARFDVPPLWLEILAVLVLKERPLSLEELLAFLYGDYGKKDNLKTSLSKMRKFLPISPHPYRITLPFKADILDLKKALNKGNIAEAVKLYRNSLLPFSNAPFIRESDEIFNEAVRQAALHSNETEVLLQLSERYEEDPVVLKHLTTLMPLGDPRISIVEARLKQIQKGSFLN
jgi:hypothetical protein